MSVAPDGSAVYMMTDDGTDFSLWRYASDWERVLAVNDADYIVRLAPDNSDVIYVAEKGGTAVYYSSDGGLSRWQIRSARVDIQDLAIEGSGDVVYALESGGTVSKSTNAGFTWTGGKSTKLSNGSTILSYGTDSVLATSQDGYVAYSTTGGGAGTWTKISKQVGDSSANVTAVASGLADGDWIYAALETSGKGIYRWQLGTSTAWEALLSSTTYGVYGLALDEGVLYAVSANSTQSSTLHRTLSPTVEVVDDTYFSTVTSSAEFMTQPQALRTGASDSNTKLWAIDSEASPDALYSFTDTLVSTKPTLVTPAAGYEAKINPVSGYTVDTTFTWNRPSTKVTAYQLRFMDADGNTVKTFTVSSGEASVSAVVGHSATNAVDLMPGETYKWKVRVASTGPVYSGWSESRTLTVEDATAAVPNVTIEPAPAPIVTVNPPAVTVNPPAVTVNPPATSTTPAIPTPYIIAIIAIGAILVIALIILIVKTRRVT